MAFENNIIDTDIIMHMEESVELSTALNHYFGFTKFRPGQQEAIEGLLNHKDSLVVMPTGFGKSLIYQLGALLMPGTALVISPLISLMKDQIDSLARRQIAATYINSSLNKEQQNRRLQSMIKQEYKIVLIAPERLREQAFCQALVQTPLSMLVVDEAHCLSQWGHDFRPDYLHIADLKRDYSIPVTLALTATATPKVQDDIVQQLKLKQPRRLIASFNRPNISLEVISTPDTHAKLSTLYEFLPNSPGGGIIYTGTRRDAEEVAEFASEVTKLPVRYYHAGLDNHERSQVQNAFIAGDLPLVVATNAFGMGIDRPDVRFVLHYTMPGSLEAYYQEVGRAGRDGLPARGILFYSPEDRSLHEYFIENGFPSINELRNIYNFIVSLSITDRYGTGKQVVLSLDNLSAILNLSEIKIRLALEQLEAGGALERASNLGGKVIRIYPKHLPNDLLNKIADQVKAHQEHKRLMLNKMVNYAETDKCRRRTILVYFGDQTIPSAPICCDNCIVKQEITLTLSRHAETQSERAALIILDTVKRLKWGLGKSKIIKILRGSKAKDIQHYNQHIYYGKFSVLKRKEVKSLIDQLISSGYIKVTGSTRPILVLTQKGKAALKSRAAVQVNMRAITRKEIERRSAQEEAGGTLELTFQLINNGLSPEQVAAERGLALSTIYSHLAKLIGGGKVNIDEVVPLEQQKLIRQVILEIGEIEYLAPIKARLPNSIDYSIIRCVVESWKLEHTTTSHPGTSTKTDTQKSPVNDHSDFQKTDPVSAFLSHPHPRILKGPWLAGWALDFHSRYDGDTVVRSSVGELAFRYKYLEEHQLVHTLVNKWIKLLKKHPELPTPDIIIPIPPSLPRKIDPVEELAQNLSTLLGIPIATHLLTKTRATRPQKEMKSIPAKQRNIAGAFKLTGNVIGKNLILIDDLYDSGATLSEAARTLQKGNPASIVVLTLTKTIHTDN